jgi:hypothetical protein
MAVYGHPLGRRRMMNLPLIHFHDFHPALGDFRADILAGLKAKQKTIAPKYFYDPQGSMLFDRICELPELSNGVENFPVKSVENFPVSL